MEKGDPLRELGSMIQSARKSLGMSQVELGRRLGYVKQPGSKISKFETGEQAPPPARFGELCEILGLPPARAVRLLARYHWSSVGEPFQSLLVDQSLPSPAGLVRQAEEMYRASKDVGTPLQQGLGLLDALDEERRARVIDVLVKLARQELAEQEGKAR